VALGGNAELDGGRAGLAAGEGATLDGGGLAGTGTAPEGDELTGPDVELDEGEGGVELPPLTSRGIRIEIPRGPCRRRSTTPASRSAPSHRRTDPADQPIADARVSITNGSDQSPRHTSLRRASSCRSPFAAFASPRLTTERSDRAISSRSFQVRRRNELPVSPRFGTKARSCALGRLLLVGGASYTLPSSYLRKRRAACQSKRAFFASLGTLAHRANQPKLHRKRNLHFPTDV
jgi:hypothetical protein